MSLSETIQRLLNPGDRTLGYGRQGSRRQGLRRGNWDRSPTKQYARGGPLRGKSAGEPPLPSRQVVQQVDCRCPTTPRRPVRHLIDGEPLTSDRRVCSRCSAIVLESVA